MINDPIRTYQNRPSLEMLSQEVLNACAELFAQVEHNLLADISRGKKSGKLKSSYLIKYGITARHFNAIRVSVEGKMTSIKELQKMQISDLKERIESLEAKVAKLQKKRIYALIAHQKSRRLEQLKQKLAQLIEDQKEGKIALCFGSRKLFRAQFHLTKNGYKNHEEWLADWKGSRASEIFFLGSKDEISGNQTCSATVDHNGALTLRIRLPQALHERFGKYLVIPAITFAYGHEAIVNSLASCKQRALLAKMKDPKFKDQGTALTYRFKRDKKGWRLFVTTQLPTPQWKTGKENGVIGIDINIDHLALVETDRFGNPVYKESIPLNLYGKSKKQALAIIGDASARAVFHAEQKLKPLIVEKLDFHKKKLSLREHGNPSRSRQLSSFAYQAILTHIKARAFAKAIEVHEVNPAFTSIIGRVKFAKRYGLSIHHAAALCIGRRYLNLSEKVPRHLDKIPDGKDSHVALSLPVRNRGKHVWSQWRDVSKKVSAALAAHFRTKRSSSMQTCS